MVQALKAGDIVRLKSGSPRMMLTSVDHRGYVRTAWAVGTDTRHGDFHLDALLGAPGLRLPMPHTVKILAATARFYAISSYVGSVIWMMVIQATVPRRAVRVRRRPHELMSVTYAGNMATSTRYAINGN